MLYEACPGDKRLVAYLVANDGSIPSGNELCAFLAQRLPSYMHPAHFISLETMPLTPSGKVDRVRLPIPALSPAYTSNPVLPRNSIERTLAEIWSRVLKVEQIGIHDDFFGLGGHSLGVMQVISEIHRSLGVLVPIRFVFESRTVAELAGFDGFSDS